MRKVTKNNYRQYYKEYYGIEFGEDYSVHHIDMNRDNNDISNLLLIPKEVHENFHKSAYSYEYGIKSINPNLKHICTCCLNPEIEMLDIYIDAVIEIQKWIGYKDTNYRVFKANGVTLTRKNL